MSSIKIGFAVWNLEDPEKQTLNKILKYFLSLLKHESSFEIIDVKYNDIEEVDYLLCFGSRADTYRKENIPSWSLQPLQKLIEKQENRENRKNFLALLKEIASTINEEQEKKTFKIEIKENITAGTDDCTFKLTEKEIDYLQKLKVLLNGSKMFIQKGDIKIEIE